MFSLPTHHPAFRCAPPLSLRHASPRVIRQPRAPARGALVDAPCERLVLPLAGRAAAMLRTAEAPPSPSARAAVVVNLRGEPHLKTLADGPAAGLPDKVARLHARAVQAGVDCVDDGKVPHEDLIIGNHGKRLRTSAAN